MQELMIFEGHEVEVLEVNGQVLFNPYHVGECLELGDSAVRMAVAKMNEKQVVKVKNSDVKNSDTRNSDVGLTNFRKLNNAGENFLTESGVYKLVFKSRKPNAEAFTDWGPPRWRRSIGHTAAGAPPEPPAPAPAAVR